MSAPDQFLAWTPFYYGPPKDPTERLEWFRKGSEQAQSAYLKCAKEQGVVLPEDQRIVVLGDAIFTCPAKVEAAIKWLTNRCDDSYERERAVRRELDDLKASVRDLESRRQKLLADCGITDPEE